VTDVRERVTAAMFVVAFSVNVLFGVYELPLYWVSNHVEFEFRVRVRVSSKFSNFMWNKTVELPN